MFDDRGIIRRSNEMKGCENGELGGRKVPSDLPVSDIFDGHVRAAIKQRVAGGNENPLREPANRHRTRVT